MAAFSLWNNFICACARKQSHTQLCGFSELWALVSIRPNWHYVIWSIFKVVSFWIFSLIWLGLGLRLGVRVGVGFVLTPLPSSEKTSRQFHRWKLVLTELCIGCFTVFSLFSSIVTSNRNSLLSEFLLTMLTSFTDSQFLGFGNCMRNVSRWTLLTLLQ
jgi:hypothetical protein